LLPLVVVLGACGSSKGASAWADGQDLENRVCVDVACAPVSGAMREVAPGEATLSTALETAVSGDVIALVPGTYVDPNGVRVPVGVALVGPCPEQAFPDGGYAEPGVRVDEASEARLEGFTLLGGALGLDIRAEGASEVSIRDVTVEGAGSCGVFAFGLVVLDAVGLSVDNTLAGNGGGLGRALCAQSGAQVTLAETRSTRNREAALFADSATLDLVDVTAERVKARVLWFSRRVLF
jgi:hypothetical protein